MRATLIVLALAAGSTSMLHAADKEDAAPSHTYQAKEHYRFNLGGESGQYTDWERTDLDGFDGLTTTVSIEKAYGAPGDKWASIARINLYGPGVGKDRAMLSFVFTVDRKNGQIEASVFRGKDKPRDGLDTKLAVGKAFNVSVLPQVASRLLVSIDNATYEVPSDFDVKGLSVIGSGVDVKFEPFNLLKRAAP